MGRVMYSTIPQITETLLKEFGMSLQQGIPDPFRTPVFRKVVSLIPEERLRKEREVTERSCNPENFPLPGDTPTPQAPLQIPEENPGKNLINNRKKNCKEQRQRRDNKSRYPAEKTKDQSNKFNEKVKTFCYFRPLPPQKIVKTDISTCRSCPQSKVGKMMRGIFRRCKNRMKSISKSPPDVDVNFVCYRCNYPCFKICGRYKTGELPVERIIPGSNDFHADEGGEMRKINLNENSPTRREAFTRKSKTSAKKIWKSAISVHSTTDSAPNDSSVQILQRKTSDRGSIPFEGHSRNTLKSRTSSERLKKFIYDVFPPTVEFIASGEDLPGMRWGKEFSKPPIDQGNENAVERERDSEENSSLQTEVLGDARSRFKLEGRVLEVIGMEGIPERNEQLCQGHQFVSMNDYLQLFYDNRRKIPGDSEGSKKVEVLYGRTSTGKLDFNSNAE
ncbi:uncharacterized protein [Fopius arisanus]|uniref:Uncharacterized protein n=1 Tax=Fopius arisanus TaxID=64838 RepID=A0A9R1T733_9HYME|nr:PREDICTED: uncharacterized protein LOC105267051 [Fopius arisanus]